MFNRHASRIRLSGNKNHPSHTSAFTIVELLIVIIVIAILATITIVAYNGIIGHSKVSVVKSDLQEAVTQLKLAHVENGTYPSDTDNIRKSDSVTFTNYTHDTNTFCLEAIENDLSDQPFHVTDSGLVEEGECPAGINYIQTITSTGCPTDLTLAVDKRDNHTYWVKKLADGKCWMLTNLAYAGGTSNGGDNTYGDVIPTGDGTSGTLSNGTGDGPGGSSTTNAKYYVHSNANPTTYPDEPSTSTDGGATNPQYGYLYNFCATMGAQNGGSQPSTSACTTSNTPSPDTSVSVCPYGWRLPTGGSGSEYEALNDAVNGGSTISDAGLLSSWCGQLSGSGGAGSFGYINTYGYYRSASQDSSSTAFGLVFRASGVYPTFSYGETSGAAVRCIAV